MTILPKAEKWLGSAAERKGRKVVKARDEDVCVKCRRVGLPVNHDHRKNRSQGGDWSPANGQLMCGSGTTGCHGWATTHPEKALEDGWAVPSWADPLVWPARRWRRTVHESLRLSWCLYDNAGGVHWITDEEAHRRMEGLVA